MVCYGLLSLHTTLILQDTRHLSQFPTVARVPDYHSLTPGSHCETTPGHKVALTRSCSTTHTDGLRCHTSVQLLKQTLATVWFFGTPLYSCAVLHLWNTAPHHSGESKWFGKQNIVRKVTRLLILISKGVPLSDSTKFSFVSNSSSHASTAWARRLQF